MKKLLPISLLLLGCSGWVHGDWNGTACVPPNYFDADEQVAIWQSTKEWQDRSKDNVNLQLNFLNNDDLHGCDVIVERKDLTTEPDHPIGLTEEPPLAGDPTFIYLTNNLHITDVDQSFYETILHEFGHYLGANHSPYCSDIMYWKYTKVYHLTDRDVNQLWHPYPHHLYDKLPYCQEDVSK